jgi:hypothetical protein
MAYVVTTPQIGNIDLSAIYTTLGVPGVGNLPSVPTWDQVGQIVTAYDPTLGYGEFILLQIPVSTAVPLGTLATYNAISTGKLYYSYVINPTTASTGAPVCVAINAVSSNASSVQWTWFQIRGSTSILKTAVKGLPNNAIALSGTAGRILFVQSTGKTIIGARTTNTTTITTTTSLVPVILGVPPTVMGL